MKTDDQLTDILTKALGRVKFRKLSVRNRVKEWDEKKIKEENVGSDFPTGAQLAPVAQSWRAGESTDKSKITELSVPLCYYLDVCNKMYKRISLQSPNNPKMWLSKGV